MTLFVVSEKSLTLTHAIGNTFVLPVCFCKVGRKNVLLAARKRHYMFTKWDEVCKVCICTILWKFFKQKNCRKNGIVWVPSSWVYFLSETSCFGIYSSQYISPGPIMFPTFCPLFYHNSHGTTWPTSWTYFYCYNRFSNIITI